MPDTDEGNGNRGCVFFERGLEKKTQAIKKTQGRCEGCSYLAELERLLPFGSRKGTRQRTK